MQNKKTLYVKPAAPWLVIPVPGMPNRLPVYGRVVDDSPYWRRRISERSVVLTTEKEIKAARAAFNAAEEEKKLAAKATYNADLSQEKKELADRMAEIDSELQAEAPAPSDPAPAEQAALTDDPGNEAVNLKKGGKK